MNRQACRGFEEDLALLAGGDLPDGEASALRSHLGACSDCRNLLDALTGDLVLLSSLSAEDVLPSGLADEAEALGPAVVAELAQTGAGTVRPVAAVEAGNRAAATPLLAALAAGLLVGAVLLLGPAQGPLSETGAADAPLLASTSPAQPDVYLPVRVSHGPVGVELSWDGDGREGAGGGHPYRVLASASPRDFTAGIEALEVAGKRLVATAALPTGRFGDRGVTYFRVQ